MTLLNAIKNFFLANGFDRNYIIGFSGGLDSSVLLSLCAKTRDTLPLKLHAMHINHNLNSHASDWAAHCKNICHQYAINFTLETIDVSDMQGSLENNARHARYDLFARHLQNNDVLLTAHHQNDQAETLLLQLLRGAGPKGLAAMAIHKSFAHAYHARPLLNFTREELLNYANENNLVWIDDDSNQNLQFTRNLIRHQILPTLVRHFPHAVKTLARSALHAYELQNLTECLSEAQLDSVKGSEVNTLSVAKLKSLVPSLQRILLRTWIAGQSIPLPSSKKLAAIQMQMLSAGSDKNPHVIWGKHCIRRYRDNLYLLSCDDDYDLHAQHILSQQYVWQLSKPLHLPGLGSLHAKPNLQGGLRDDIKSVTVRFRHGGEIINLPQRGHRTLKCMLQEWGVLPWLRHKIPLLYYDEQLIVAVGYFIHPAFRVNEGEGNMITMQWV